MTLNENFIDQTELDSLMLGLTEKESKNTLNGAIDVNPYGFTSQKHIDENLFPSLEHINERFKKLLKTGLFNLLCKNLEITAGCLRTEKYSDFTQQLFSPSNVYILKINPLPGNALVTIDYNLIFMIVDNLFGSNGTFPNNTGNRECSQTEQRIVNHILKVIFESLQEAWEEIYNVNIDLIRSEIDLKFASVTQPNDIVLTTSFKIEIGSLFGNLNLCIPINLISPIQELLHNKTIHQSSSVDHNWAAMLKREVQSIDVELKAKLTTINLTLGEIQNMKVNDVIPIELPEIINVTINNIQAMECSYGKLKNKYALRIENLIDNSHNDS